MHIADDTGVSPNHAMQAGIVPSSSCYRHQHVAALLYSGDVAVWWTEWPQTALSTLTIEHDVTSNNLTPALCRHILGAGAACRRFETASPVRRMARGQQIVTYA
jgi:hypothetical protein